MYNEQSLLDELKVLGVSYEYYSHEPLFTVEQANALTINIKGSHCKNLFVKNSKGDKWILTMPGSERADLKSIAEKLVSSRLSFCSADEMQSDIGVTPGAVTPLAIVNNSEKNVKLVVDKKLADNGIINCHPLINTATISIAFSDLVKFVEHTGHGITVLELCATNLNVQAFLNA